MRARLVFAAALLLAPQAAAQEAFTFSIEEVAQKPFEWGGYAELKSDWTRWRTESPFRRLARPGGQPATSLRLQPGLTLNGILRQGPFRLVASGNITYLADSTDVGRGDALLYESYGLAEWAPGNAVAFGKRVLRWSKSYAFQPVGFVERARDPTDPDAAREGYWMGTLELTRSFAEAGPLRTLGATAVLLPVSPAFNREFAADRGLNAALRLTALVADTDLDLYAFTGDSRANRLGIGAGRNLLAELVVYGEAAWTAEEPRPVVLDRATGRMGRITTGGIAGFVGLRWQAPTDTTVILEYLHNGTGIRPQEFADALALIDRAGDRLEAGLPPAPGDEVARRLARAYQRPQPLRDYLYLRVSHKEPWGLLYVTPAFTAIVDAANGSATLQPEVSYTGFTNLELRLRAQATVGERESDFGARAARARVEFRLRAFF
ncbi:hypothetical protein [Elioraea thermophila]|uniref:hypothetical protein n=1 Tax=Elioraea thermophila TaxID=2185104 RepID=UPI000DF13357|nr:hypothetical protein [Elioraea thermophila]